MLKSYIAADAKPTVEIFNQLTSFLPKGIYTGGGVFQGPGRQVTIEPFTAKAKDGFTIVSEIPCNIEIPTYPNQSWALVLFAKGWTPGDFPKEHKTEFRVIPWVGGTLPGYTGENLDPNIPYYLLFAKIDALSNQVRILPNEINTSFADRINFKNLSSTQVLSGTSKFNGPDGARVYHGINHSNYKVNLTPSETPNVGIGDIWVEKEDKYFVVRTNGETKTSFDWTVTSSQASLGVDAQTTFGSKFGKAVLKDPVVINHEESKSNYILIASNLGIRETIQPIPHSIHEEKSARIVTTFPLQNIPIAWQLISNIGRPDLVFDEFTITPTSRNYLYAPGQQVDSNSIRAFAYPERPYSQPILKVVNASPDTIQISYTDQSQVTPGTLVRLAIFRNPGAYPQGFASGSNVIEVRHNLDLNLYVPFIAFTSISGHLSGYNLEIGRDSFRISLPAGVTASFNWLIVPSFSN